MNRLERDTPRPAPAAPANPISRTAYYALAVRAWDAARPRPACGDHYAAMLMNADARGVWARFETLDKPNGSNATRHAIIDDGLRAELDENPRARIVLIGAGFDTRAFRLRGGRWIEVDEPGLLEEKEQRLPAARAQNPLTRVPVRFAREPLVERLSPFAGPEPTIVVVEGVLMYLTQAERNELLQTLKTCYPRHTLYCDLMRRSFAESYGREIRSRLAALGAGFKDMTEQPEQLLLDHGYRSLLCRSIPLEAAERRAIDVPAFAIRWFLGKLRRGYCVWKWIYDAPPSRST